MDNESDSSERWEDFFGSSTSLAPSLLGYYDSLATKVSDDPNVNSNTEISAASSTTTNIKTANSSISINQQSIITTERSFQSSSSLKLKSFSLSNGTSLRPTRAAPQLPKSGDKFRNLSNNVARILSNTETAVDGEPNRPRPPPTPFHRNHIQSASFNSGRATTSSSRYVFKNFPLSKNITKLSHLGCESVREPSKLSPISPDLSNGNCDTSIEEDIPKLSFIQQRIKSLTSALFDADEADSEVSKNQIDQQPVRTVQEDVDPEPVLRNPEKSMDASEADPHNAFVENCDESEHRNTIVETRNPYLNLVVVEPAPEEPQPVDRSKSFPRNVQISPKLPRSTSTSTPSLDTSSASLSSSKTSLTQQNAPGTPILSTRPLSASSICSYSSSSSSGSEHLLLVNGKCCGAPSYQASVESLADQSECEQGTAASGLTMCERAVMEIIDSERSYVEDLGQIIKGYLEDWKERACLKVDELEILFSNIQEIWDFNSRLLDRLNETKGDPVKISGCFIDLHENFDCYTTYCTRYPEAIALLTSLLQATHTNALLIHTQKMLNHNLPLGSYLLKPVQRILKYHLLLDNLRKHCDDKQVSHAHELMKSVAHNIDQVKKKLEQQSRVKELAGIVDGWLGPDLSVLGELRQEGLLSEHAKPRVVLLFQTMLIITKPKEDKRLQFRAYIPCKNLMLVEHLPGEPTSFNVIPYNDPKGQIKLTARNRDQKRHWAQQIKQAMLEHFDIPKRAKELVLQLGDEDDRMADKNASWKWPTHHPSTPEYLERRQQFRRSEMRNRSKKMHKKAASTISLDGISQKDIKQPTFQSYSKALEQECGEGSTPKEDTGGCKCDSVKKELEQKQLKSRSRSESRLPEDRKATKMSDEEIFAKAMAERNRFATQRRKTKESLVDVKSYNSTTIPKRIANMRKTRSKTLTGNSTFYTDLEVGDGEENTTVLKITESTDNLSLVETETPTEVDMRKCDDAKEMTEEDGSLRRDSDIISQLVLEKTEFRKMSRPPKKKSFDSVRSLSCTSQDEDGSSERKEVEEEQVIPELPKTDPPEDAEEEEFRKVDKLNKESEDLLNRLNEIQTDLASPEPIYESLLRNVHVPYKYAPPLSRSISQQYGKVQESFRPDSTPRRSRPDSDYVTLAYSENRLINIDGHSVVPKSSIAQLRNSDTNINYHHPWRKDEESGPVQDTRSEIVTLANEDALKPLERQGSLSIKSPKNLLQRFISLHASSSTTGSCDSNLNQRKVLSPEDPTPIYKQGSLDLGSRIANLDYADPRTLFTAGHQRNILINRASIKPLCSDLEQRDSIFSLNSSNDSVCGVQNELDDDSCGFYEKSVEECLENEDFRDSAVYSGDDNRPDLDEQVVYESIAELNEQRLLRPASQVVRSSSSASSSSSGPPPPVPVKPAHLEQLKKIKPQVANVSSESNTSTKLAPAPKGWVLQQVKRFQ
ncbi:pleckstrin homology domain-containing family G member 3 [Aedes aegypti]|uniref:DH domain-containing protein n=1 Tax=Aedes aegypti TaxID=7159 RepID=A0A903TP57_AEDAE|nr:pleckstrin homology domain-containing family G member 3 [Aedes aegypti]